MGVRRGAPNLSAGPETSRLPRPFQRGDPYIPSLRYSFVRARQLEGTFPGDKQTGTWPITSHRICYGWGLPPEQAYPPEGSDWPPIEPPRIDLIAKGHRQGPYRRLRTMAECIQSVSTGNDALVSLDITDKWASPPGGRISAPSSNDVVLPTHHVSLDEYDATNHEFRFWNSWGEAWGDHGCGYINADVLEGIWWEGWKLFPPTVITPTSGVLPQPRSWAFKETDGSILHWLDLVDATGERLGWVSALQRGSSLEIEELFVRPRYRRAGLGKKLFTMIHRMATDHGFCFRTWISFADTAPENMAIIERVVRPAGLSIQASGVRWAPLVAAPVWGRRMTPVPSFAYPEKPPSSPAALVKLVSEFLVGAGSGAAGMFIYDAIRSWVGRKNGGRIRARIGDVEVETTELSLEEFRKLLTVVHDLKVEDEIRSKLLEAGITITIVERRK